MANYIKDAELYFNINKSPNVDVAKDRLQLLFKLSDVSIDLEAYHQQISHDPIGGANPIRYVRHLAMLLGKAWTGHVIPQGDNGGHWYRVASDAEIILVYQYAIELGYGTAAASAIRNAVNKRLTAHPNSRIYADHLIEILGG